MVTLEARFQEISDTLSVFSDFALLPVEVPTRVEGEALAQWFQRQGKRVVFFNSNEEPGYVGLAGKLVELRRDDVDLVIVLGGAKNNAGLLRELAAVNFSRDLLVRELARPILWCGPPSFLNETWANAPDFWSVRESGFVIKPAINAPREVHNPNPAWTPQIRIPVIKIPHEIRPAPRFVGRKAELKQLETAFSANTGPVAITAVHGMPGVGKSFLAEHFANLQKDRFPDGIFRISLNADEQRSPELLEETLAMKLGLKTRHGLDDLLAERRVLLLVENVDSDVHVNLTTRFLEPRRHLLSVIVTGRVTGIGRRQGWRQIPLGGMDKDTALELFREWGISPRTRDEREVLHRLAEELAYLPLALALAAGYIEAGGRAQLFLDELRRSKLQWKSPELAAIADDGERARQVIGSSFAISRQLAEREVGAGGCAALAMMGTVLRQEFGADLGAAVSGLDSAAFERLIQVATHLSLLETVQASPITPRFQFHPLMAVYLESITSGEDKTNAWERLSAFFESRMLLAQDVSVDERKKCQNEVLAEWRMLEDWLERMPDSLVVNLASRCRDWGEANGPYMAWAHLHERASKLARTKVERIWAQLRWADVLRLAGEYALSEQVAQDALDACGDEYPREKAKAWGRIADILTKRGELDEALRIRREKQVPVFERLGDVRERAVALGKVADILVERGELDEALRILREEELPVYERLGDVRSRAVALGKVADILEARGEVDEALRIRREEELPVYERLGDVREQLLARTNLALTLAKRGRPEDHPEIEKLLALALRDARRLRIPEVQTIEGWLRHLGKDPNAPPFA